MTTKAREDQLKTCGAQQRDTEERVAPYVPNAGGDVPPYRYGLALGPLVVQLAADQGDRQAADEVRRGVGDDRHDRAVSVEREDPLHFRGALNSMNTAGLDWE
ncbi:hypothetical protein [Catellatospora sichuanensis]|uniref:hypothetical protein n=1 Tax=Catellatospora sichuanensis TaxID=1969805 RepID=UPI00118253A4|nr:hypothetical protein [Catellatospora sichuanensis]